MELAIPIVGLGSLFLLSNKEKKENTNNSKTENFQNAGASYQTLPNTNIPPRNFPIENERSVKKSVNYYPNPTKAADRYFSQVEYEKTIEGLPEQKVESLTGDAISIKDFKHNNMMPFFGSKVTQPNLNNKNYESILDNKQGMGSQLQTKEAIAPMFEPQENMDWAFGTPNHSDFFQSRMNPSANMSNVKPWEEIRVGPGLNKGYSKEGTSGFNAGMEARDQWIAKTVDELRVATNPKVTYAGRILGGKSHVTERGQHGKVEKYRPDTYYINSPDRYFTTVGQEKAQTARAIQTMQQQNRDETNIEYFGSGNGFDGNTAPYVPGQYKPSNKVQLGPYQISNTHAAGKYDPTSGDYGKDGYKLLPNARTLTTDRQPQLGAVGTFAKAVIAPLMDILRPSRKENVIGNMNPTGYMNSVVKTNPVYNPADRPRTTTKETTVDNPYPMNMGNKEYSGYGYVVSEQQPVFNQRDTTNEEYFGDAGNTNGTANAPVYNAAYNAYLNVNKEQIARGRNPMGSNVKLFNGESNTNIQIKKMDNDRANNRMYVPQSVINTTPSKQFMGELTARSEYGQGIQCQRNSPDILNAFRENVYTKSLHSVA